MELRSQGWLINHKRLAVKSEEGHVDLSDTLFLDFAYPVQIEALTYFVGVDILLNFFVNVFSLSPLWSVVW